MRYIDGIPVWGEPDPGAIEQIRRVAADDSCVGAALMADHHKGYSMPIGGVAAYSGHVSPSGVGYDIACGNKAVLTNLHYDQIADQVPAFMDRIFNEISFGVGRKNAEKVEHPLFDDDPAWEIPFIGKLKDLARAQLGTVGSGNHYVDLLVDELERVWIGVHFGSRGLGHKIATYYLEAAGAVDTLDAAPTLLPVNGDLGEQYIAAMHLAGRYAYAGRNWVCDKVLRIIGGRSRDEIHNHHNYAWHESHLGMDLWVVRKGATPAFPRQRGFVGGSMGDISVILKGRLHSYEHGQQQLDSFWSTVHGAGRIRGRQDAIRGPIVGWQDKDGQMLPFDAGRGTSGSVRPPAGARPIRDPANRVKEADMTDWLKSTGNVWGRPIELRGAGVDEAPQVYKKLSDVLKEHAGQVEVEHVLKPIGVAMAGKDVKDPYRD